MQDKNTNIEALIVDALIERPQRFEIGGRAFMLYPATLGKSYLLANLIQELELNAELMALNPVVEVMRVASTKYLIAARIIAYAVCKTKNQLFDYDHVEALVDFFACISTEDRATLLNAVLAQDITPRIIAHYGIDKDLEQMEKAQRIKAKEDNSLTFCGKSPWGSTIDYLAERYGWTLDYILWGISHTAVQMLMTDNVRNVYLSADERKHMHVAHPGDEVIDANKLTAADIAALNLH